MTNGTHFKSAYSWVTALLSQEGLLYSGFVSSVPPDPNFWLYLAPSPGKKHDPLLLRSDDYDLNDQPDREQRVREWGESVRRAPTRQ
jgi:hypothetical protein